MASLAAFMKAALPWLGIGLFLAILCVRSAGQKKTEEAEDNYGTIGMSLGMCFGTAIGTAMGNNTGIGIVFGMLLGLAIGSNIKKDASR